MSEFETLNKVLKTRHYWYRFREEGGTFIFEKGGIGISLNSSLGSYTSLGI